MTTHKNNGSSIDDLLVKYLLKETSEAESVHAEQWINASPEQAKHFEQLQQIWQNSLIGGYESPSENDAWERFRNQVQTKKESANTHKIIPFSRWMTAAAVLLVVIAGSWIWFQRSHSTADLYTLSSGDRVITDTLTDKTIITLNKNSTLSYLPHFNEKNRNVALEGEAFFNVAHETKKPFVVHVNHVTITVLGTSFNVNGSGNTTEVIVASGSVKVSGAKNSVALHANEKVVIAGAGGLLKKVAVNDKLYSYYRTRTFVCDNTPLADLVKTLNDAYDADIVMDNPRLNQLKITSTFYRDQSLDTILSIISQTFTQVTITRQDNQIILK